MPFKFQEVELSRIYLDNNNPRHDPIQDEPAIIAHLIAKEAIRPLAKHIAEAGQMSPLERLAVVAHPKASNAYVALEGNRRICALKLLADPQKAGSEKDKAYFRGLAAKISIPLKSQVVLFRDKETARPWISLRHEGEQGGVGTKSWDPGQKARFNAQGTSTTNPNIQSLLLKEYAQKQRLFTAEELDAISLTTLTRYLSNPVFRATLGLSDNKTLGVLVPQEEFNVVVRRFLSDALKESPDVNSRTNADQRKAYAQKLRSEGVAPTTHKTSPEDFSKLPPAPKDPSNKNKQRNNRSPDDRKTVIDTKFTANIKNKTLKRLYDELRGIDATEFPFAATYLLRAVIEHAATLLLKQEKKPFQGDLHIKLGHVEKILAIQGMSDRELKFLRTMASNKDSTYSPDSLGHFVHGGAVPTHTQAIKLWDNLEQVMASIFGQLK